MSVKYLFFCRPVIDLKRRGVDKALSSKVEKAVNNLWVIDL